MRDLKMNPYSTLEKKVADYIVRITKGDVGGGDDPVGWLMASHEVMVMDRAQRIEDGKVP